MKIFSMMSLSEAFNLVMDKLQGWMESVVTMLPNFVVALSVLVLFYLLARLAQRLSHNIIAKFSQSDALVTVFTTVIRVSIVGIGLVVALNVLQLQQTVTSLLAGAGIIGLALGFAFQDIAANFMAGILMAFRQPIKVGDIIETNGYMGEVEKINLRVTIIRTFQGLHVLIPNKDVFQKALVNYTKTNDRRIDLNVGVSYGDDLKKVKEIVLETIESLPYRQTDKDVSMVYEEFGSSSINFRVMFWIDYPDQPGYLKAKSDAIIAIKEAFDNYDITIPFPIRTLDFGIKGGQTLNEMYESNGHLQRS